MNLRISILNLTDEDDNPIDGISRNAAAFIKGSSRWWLGSDSAGLAQKAKSQNL
jgi:hypothetical protein